jgi:SAM-dependent methyltransferase
MNRILMPLFGAQNMTMKRMEELEQDFTGFFENVFLVVVDEIQTSASLKQAKITSKLKNLMVEPHISIRKMYREPYMARNYCNMIFTSNMPDPIVVAQDDRRFNVGNYQKKAINITEAEIAQTRIRFITNSVMDVMTKLTDRAYDLVVFRHNPEDLSFAISEAHRILRSGGVFVIDNFYGGGKVPDPAQRDPKTIALREAGKAVKADTDSWVTSLIPIGDGLLLATKL